LFGALKTYGNTYSAHFWGVVFRGVLFPIFDDLKLSRSEKRKFADKVDMSEWLSTTLVQALRNLVDLFSSFFGVLSFLLDNILALLCMCISQGTPCVLFPLFAYLFFFSEGG
jgi:brefeldin A-inhibited guanine nucleotide-exchange protein